jgi:hypothetical protein
VFLSVSRRSIVSGAPDLPFRSPPPTAGLERLRAESYLNDLTGFQFPVASCQFNVSEQIS